MMRLLPIQTPFILLMLLEVPEFLVAVVVVQDQSCLQFILARQ